MKDEKSTALKKVTKLHDIHKNHKWSYTGNDDECWCESCELYYNATGDA